jgi:FkbM family methyltransferase
VAADAAVKPELSTMAQSDGTNAPPLPRASAFRLLTHVFKRYYNLRHTSPDDNYDWDRFPPHLFPPPTKRSYMEQRARYMRFFLRNCRGLAFTYESLKDDVSRQLFIQLILYRLLGHRHLRILPSTNFSLGLQSDRGQLDHFDGLQFSGTALKLDTWAQNIATYFIKRQYYFLRSGVEICPEAGDTVVDAGACLGDTSVAFACSVGKAGNDFAFDPLPAHVRATSHNAAQNDLSNRITVVPYALGSQIRNMEAAVKDGSRVLTGFSVVGKENCIPTITLDQSCVERKIHKNSLHQNGH